MRTPDPDDCGQARTPSPVNLLQAQVNQLSAQLEQAQEREARLLTLLEAEQQARRDLETKLLPAPKLARTSHVQLSTLVFLLVVALAFAGWHFRAVIVSALTP